MNTLLPLLAPPAQLRGAERGTFASDTVLRRMPAIVRRVVSENAFPPTIEHALETLAAEIPFTPLRVLHDAGAPDAALWAAWVAPYAAQNWLDVPWFFAETYMFRRILEATGFFGSSVGANSDPYQLQKHTGLALSTDAIGALASAPAVPQSERLTATLHGSLWGNQADLSLWPAEQGGRPDKAAPHAERLLVDDSVALATYLLALAGQGAQIDLVLDNAGFELLCDLVLVDVLLGLELRVVLHAKPYPTYVSDVTEPDLAATIAWLLAHPQPAVAAFGARLHAAMNERRLTVQTDWFWISPLPGWELPATLHARLARSSLIISKGDANYRRWLGDRHWPFDTALDAVLAYAPAPIALLRTCKSEVAIGIDVERQAAATAHDPAWLTNGHWGVIQFRS
jgi:uncharacterized protein with ATP-grasp and redox domains